MENKQRSIEVRVKRIFNIRDMEYEGGEVLKTIKRIPFHRGWFGNWVPVYVRYNRKEYNLQSNNGDVSDPFRGGDIGSFYIEVEGVKS